jgi:Zn-dependent M32 family carboxypeptidase
MPDQKEALKKTITELADKLSKLKAAGKDLKKDADARASRKALKRAQRRLALLSPLTHDQKIARQTKLVDMINKRLGELTQGAKKVQANPYVRSCKKKLKSLNKLKKRLDRQAKKAQAKAAPAAAAAAPAAPEGDKK